MSECERVGGVALRLLPNLASESETAGMGEGFVGETDISGLRLLKAHLRLDWAEEGLDLTSPTEPSHIYMCTFIFF